MCVCVVCVVVWGGGGGAGDMLAYTMYTIQRPQFLQSQVAGRVLLKMVGGLSD